MEKKDIIIGGGQVGYALNEILGFEYNIDTYDIKNQNKEVGDNYRIMHVCFPYNKKFITEVKKYFIKFNPKVIIIHSTIKVGTTQKLIEILKYKAITNSPIRGQHNQLIDSIKIFTKFVGIDYPNYKVDGINLYNFIQEYFKKVSIHIVIYKDSRMTELAKMLCLFQYGMHNVVAYEAKKICKKFNLNYDKTVLFWNETYNQGYDIFRTDFQDYHRPLLKPSMENGWGEKGIYESNKMLYEQLKNPMIRQILKYGQKK